MIALIPQAKDPRLGVILATKYASPIYVYRDWENDCWVGLWISGLAVS